METKRFGTPFLDALLSMANEFAQKADLSTPARIWKPKYILQYKCKCGKIVRIVSKTKARVEFTWFATTSQLFKDNKCPRNSYKNPCHHKFVKTIIKFEKPSGVMQVSKKHFERLTYGS